MIVAGRIYVPEGTWPLRALVEKDSVSSEALVALDLLLTVGDVTTSHAVVVAADELRRAICEEGGGQSGGEGLDCLLEADTVTLDETRVIREEYEDGRLLPAGEWPILARSGHEIAIGVVTTLDDHSSARRWS